MKVRIVSYEDVNAWILGKFARKLNDELKKLGIDSDISKSPDDSADINHHIIYINYEELKSVGVDTIMITHIDDIRKLNQLKKQLLVAKMGICMSRSTMMELANAGIPSEKLAFVNPAHDEVILPKPYNIGITSKVQPDGCKRQDMLLKLIDHISPDFFRFSIMGEGWNDIIDVIKEKGFNVTYYDKFDYDQYVKLVPEFDYYLYFGQDEGSMGFIDALAAGVKTIVTPQGFHLDPEKGIVHSFNTVDELIGVFKLLTNDKLSLINSVSNWTWKDYAIKHIELWNHILNPDKKIKSKYYDGVNSIQISENNNLKGGGRRTYFFKLYLGTIKRTFFKIKNIKNFKTLIIKIRRFAFTRKQV